MVSLRFGSGVSVAVLVVFVLCLSDAIHPHPEHKFGIVPKPQPSSKRIAFSVRKAMPNSISGNVRIFFQDTLTNQGRSFNPYKAEFVAPYPGGYFFTFHAISDPTKDFMLALMKNGDYQVTAYGSKGQYNAGSNSALLDLNAGDRVYLQLQYGGLYEHPNGAAYTTFTGFMVYGL